MKAHVQGGGKVGGAIAKALRHRGWPVTLRPQRKPLPHRLDAEVVLLAVRDSALNGLACRMADGVAEGAVVIHVSGAHGPEVLAPLRGHCRGVGQMHPMLAFASKSVSPLGEGGEALIRGDRSAVRAARAVARALGLKPRVGSRVDPAGYHAAAALVAGGAVALAETATRILVDAGMEARAAEKMLGPLIRSIGDNVARLGTPQSLTGAIRRGDSETIASHIDAVRRLSAGDLGLYLACARAQLPMARVLGEARSEDLDGLDGILGRASRTR